jgi:hypothetical protein
MGGSNGRQTVGNVRSVSQGLSRLRIEHLWMLVPVVLLAWMGFMHALRPLDFWWHLKMGEVIYTLREIPRVDLFSFTRAGQPFVHQNWLGEVLYYLTYRVGGFPLLITFNTMLLLLALIPILHLCLEASHRLRVAILCSFVAAVVLGFFGSMRPQSYSFVLFAVFYWILWSYRDGRRDFLWALPLLMTLWVNLHGAFVLGIGLIGVVLGTETVRRAVRGPRTDTLAPSALAKLAVILALTLLASMANPEGVRVYAYVRQLQVDPASQQFVAEWQVPDVKDRAGVLLFFGPFFVALLVFLYARPPLSLTELGLFFAFAVLGLGSLRNSIWFALIVAPILARHAMGLRVPNGLDELRLPSYLQNLVRRLERRESKGPTRYGLNWMILILLVLFTVTLSPWVRPHLKGGRLGELVDRGTPVGAMDYIAEHRLTGNIFHPQVYGDYLIWRLWPQQRSFIDGRVHLYDEAFARQYILTFRDENWESRLARHDIKYVLLPKGDDNSKSMIEAARSSMHWTLLYEDDISVLFEKLPPKPTGAVRWHRQDWAPFSVVRLLLQDAVPGF